MGVNWIQTRLRAAEVFFLSFFLSGRNNWMSKRHLGNRNYKIRKITWPLCPGHTGSDFIYNSSVRQWRTAAALAVHRSFLAAGNRKQKLIERQENRRQHKKNCINPVWRTSCDFRFLHNWTFSAHHSLPGVSRLYLMNGALKKINK